MTSSNERCPTCDGTGFVARHDQRYPCPTCSPSSDGGGPYFAADDPEQSRARRIARVAVCAMAAAALVAVLAMLINALWH